MDATSGVAYHSFRQHSSPSDQVRSREAYIIKITGSYTYPDSQNAREFHGGRGVELELIVGQDHTKFGVPCI